MHGITLVLTEGVWREVQPIITSSVSWVDIVQLIVLPLLLPTLVGLVSKSSWPTLGKRLTLGGLALVTTVLTNVVEAAITNTSYDIGWGLLQFAATWGLAELAYYGLLKAPIEPVKEPVEIEGAVIPQNLGKLTKAELISTIENVPTAIVTVEEKPRSLASIIQASGNR